MVGVARLASALAVVNLASGAVPVPTAAQLRYQQQELVALTHFNVSIRARAPLSQPLLRCSNFL